VRFVGEGRNAHRKAGLMLRASLAADAPYAYAVVHGDGLVSLKYRETPGGLPDHDMSIAVMVSRYGGSCASLIVRDLSRTAAWHLGTGFFLELWGPPSREKAVASTRLEAQAPPPRGSSPVLDPRYAVCGTQRP
jgi:hypothetical protein